MLDEYGMDAEAREEMSLSWRGIVKNQEIELLRKYPQHQYIIQHWRYNDQYFEIEGGLVMRDEAMSRGREQFYKIVGNDLPFPLSIDQYPDKLPTHCMVCSIPLPKVGVGFNKLWYMQHMGHTWYYGIHHRSCGDILERTFRQFEDDVDLVRNSWYLLKRVSNSQIRALQRSIRNEENDR